VQQLDKKNRTKIHHVIEPTIPVYYRPKITTPSTIIQNEDFEILWSWLPSRFRIRDPLLLFSTSTDGYSLISLLKAIGDTSPTILILKTQPITANSSNSDNNGASEGHHAEPITKAAQKTTEALSQMALLPQVSPSASSTAATSHIFGAFISAYWKKSYTYSGDRCVHHAS
jgi:hypothetical protein